MKKLALVTCYYQDNIGSMLQAYATQKVCIKLGYDCEHINIAKLQNKIKIKKIFFYMKQIFNIQILKEIIIKRSKRIIAGYVFKSTIGLNINKRKEKFEEFRISHFILSPAYSSVDKLKKACKRYEAVIVGSDQLWLPSNIYADYFTLNWVPDHIKKISYATSFGVSCLSSKTMLKAKKFLARIEFISVRENSGKKIVKECLNTSVPVVCDPTLLLGNKEWDELKTRDKIIKTPYVFCYILGSEKEIREFALRIKQNTGYELVTLPHLERIEDEIYSDINLYEIGPCEFLNLIYNAEYIITDSFHGSVFSMIYRKKFWTFKRMKEDGILNTNGRIESLFSLLGITKCLIDGAGEINQYIDMQLDYNCIEEKIEKYREYSIKYLKKALEEDVCLKKKGTVADALHV